MMGLLDNLNFPEDLKKLNDNEYNILSKELRGFLIDSVSKTGGHLSSNLGVVELTLSLFKVFDFTKDKIIWDVGHQSYVYKILTGRKDQFKQLRTYEGMSGFPKRNESRYDFFDTGHSSTSISAGMGMARARDIKKEKYNVISVIGDGALTGGMALEALNDAGFKKTRIIVILNDNQMSISHNVGGLSSYLNKIRITPKYTEIKSNIHASLDTSNIGKNIAGKISKVKGSIKQLVIPTMFFEDMGVKYIGPIDGHNIKEMCAALEKAKAIKGPVVIHTITQKGKGYDLAEKSPTKYHGVGPFDLESGELKSNPKNNYSKEFGKVMCQLSSTNKDIVAITAAMPEGTGLSRFAKEFPDRFFDVGIAEQHAVTLAAGMACNGLKPVVAIYSTFLQRAFDQIVHDVCIQNLPVIFAVDRAGIVGEDGETHQGTMDLSYLSLIPNMTIMSPKCICELDYMIKWALNKSSPVAIRYPRGGDIIDNLMPMTDIKYGKWEILNNGSKVCIIACGKMVQHAMLAKDLLYERGVNPMIVNAAFIKPVDKELLKKLKEDGYNILTVEDNCLNGGLGAAVISYLSEIGYKKTIRRLGYDDEFVPQGKIDILYKKYGLDCESISNAVINLYD